MILDYENGLPNNLAIVNYKTATGKDVDNVFAFQLAIYAAAGRGEGLNVQAAYLHRLKEGKRGPVPIDDPVTKEAKTRAGRLIADMAEGKFPAKPGKKKCRGCDVPRSAGVLRAAGTTCNWETTVLFRGGVHRPCGIDVTQTVLALLQLAGLFRLGRS